MRTYPGLLHRHASLQLFLPVQKDLDLAQALIRLGVLNGQKAFAIRRSRNTSWTLVQHPSCALGEPTSGSEVDDHRFVTIAVEEFSSIRVPSRITPAPDRYLLGLGGTGIRLCPHLG